MSLKSAVGVGPSKMEQAVRNMRVVGSPGFPPDEDEARQHAGLTYDRSYDRLGMLRQFIAVIASGDGYLASN
jgi:hypothetical protein